MTMAHVPTVEFPNVFVVREAELALFCEIGGKHYWVARSRLEPGSTVRREGDVGVVVVSWDFALECGWVPREKTRRRSRCGGLTLKGLPCRSAQLPRSRFGAFHDPGSARVSSR